MSNVLLEKATANLADLVKQAQDSGYSFENWLEDNSGITAEEYNTVIDDVIGNLSLGDWGVAAAIGFQLGFDVAVQKQAQDSTDAETKETEKA